MCGVVPARASVVLICCSLVVHRRPVLEVPFVTGNARLGAAGSFASIRPGTVAVSKNRAWAICAFTVERWNGLVIRKVGSGRSPVSSRSGKAVMKITGTENSARMSLTASMPELSSASWMSARTRPGRLRHRLRHRLVAGDGDAGDVVAEIADDGLDVHRDDRLVLDDQHVGAGLPLDLGERLGDQGLDLLGRGADQIAGILGREAFHRGQQQRLARQRRDPRQPRLGDALGLPSGSAWPGSSSILADDQMAWKVR